MFDLGLIEIHIIVAYNKIKWKKCLGEQVQLNIFYI